MKKLTIIVISNGNSQSLLRCINSIYNQSYANIEVIIINDITKEIRVNVGNKYNNVKFIKSKLGMSLLSLIFKAIENSHGDYITFINSEDYVSVDFYRPLLEKATSCSSDIVIGNTVYENENGEKFIYNLFTSAIPDTLNDDECFEQFYRTEGLCEKWYYLSNKIYSRNICENLLNCFKKKCLFLNNNIDTLLSTIFFYYAKRVDNIDYDCIYKHFDNGKSNNLKKEISNDINELNSLFSFFEYFFNDKEIFQKYEINLNKWKALFFTKIKDHVANNEDINNEDKCILNKKIDSSIDLINIDVKNHDYFYKIKTFWKDNLEWIKERICDNKIKVISFDIFDTLITRPFLQPNDLFKILSEEFRNLTNPKNCINFESFRSMSENNARAKRYDQYPDMPEITLEEIYKNISETYKIDSNLLNKIMQKEIDLEYKYCAQRKTAFELYKLALFNNKKVICTSDMYLSKNDVKNMLNKTGYKNFDNIYISSEIKYTKSIGNLYDYVKNDLNVSFDEIVHIGDNYKVDVEVASKKGICACFFPRTINLYWDINSAGNLSDIAFKSLGIWQDNVNSNVYIGIRCMIAVVANMYFDNPFRPFNNMTTFNADPILIGYYALGTHLFAVSKWLLDDVIEKKYEKIVFMARDGYLPMKACQILDKIYDCAPKYNYLPISRKALISIILQSDLDFYKLAEIINYNTNTPKMVYEYMNDILCSYEEFKKICFNNKIDINSTFNNLNDFYKFILLLKNELYNKDLHNKKMKLLKDYFDDMYSGKSCTFDIGYSGRPEAYISSLCKKNIHTYFELISSDSAFINSKIGKFDINTFFDYKPSVTGSIREIIISEIAPSCIGYDCSNDVVQPIYEEFIPTYQEKFILELIQKNALKFINDMVNIFGKDIYNLYYQKMDAAIPLEFYIHSSGELDQEVMSCVMFEDDVGVGNNISLVDIWNKERKNHNQLYFDK